MRSDFKPMKSVEVNFRPGGIFMGEVVRFFHWCASIVL